MGRCRLGRVEGFGGVVIGGGVRLLMVLLSMMIGSGFSTGR
jgi:hypothetical protein